MEKHFSYLAVTLYIFWKSRQIICLFFGIFVLINKTNNFGENLKVLSNQEEILMLAIKSLGEEAYGVPIRKKVSKVTGKEWSIGAIYDPLYRLEKKEYIKSELSNPTNERGGRSKRIFSITESGMKALQEHRRVRDQLWGSIPEFKMETI